MASLSTTIRIRPERRQAILHIPTYNAGSLEPADIHEETVLVWTTCSREHALCEHPDGTFTSENWDHVKMLDSHFLFDELCWDDADA